MHGLWFCSNARKAPLLCFPHESVNVRFCCWTLAPKTCSRQITASICHDAISALRKARGSPACPPRSLPAKTQLKLITYQEYQRPHKACAAQRRRLSLAPFFPFHPAWLGLWQSPRTSEGGAEGGLGGQQLPEHTHGLILICGTACSFPLHRCC